MKKTTKIIIACALAVIICTGSLLFFTLQNKNPEPVKNIIKSDDSAKYIAHRGFSGIAPENTIPAFKKAGENGYYGCEFDIHPTKDGVWAVMHDVSLKAMTGQKGNISDYTFEELQAFNITAGKNINDYQNTKIPSLEQALDEIAKYPSMRPFIEIKSGGEKDIEMLINILEERKLINKVTIISFHMDYLEQLRAYSPNIMLQFLISEITDNTVQSCIYKKINAVSFDGRITKNHDKIKSIIDANLTAATWTIDTLELTDKLYQLGVRYITTNVIMP